jgi:hypothetical protein
MKIRLLTDVSTRAGSHEAGAVLDLDDAQGQAMVATGLAEAVHEVQQAVKYEPDTAMRGEAPERATLPRGRPR